MSVCSGKVHRWLNSFLLFRLFRFFFFFFDEYKYANIGKNKGKRLHVVVIKNGLSLSEELNIVSFFVVLLTGLECGWYTYSK